MNNVTHPSHYNSGKVEVIEGIEAWGFGEGFRRGNAIKYIARAGKKDKSKEIEDLEKAAWYLAREIEILKAERDGRDATRPNDMNDREPWAWPCKAEGCHFRAPKHGYFCILHTNSRSQLGDSVCGRDDCDKSQIPGSRYCQSHQIPHA